MSLRVIEPGLYSLLVGRKRPASRHLGVPVGGPADFATCDLGNSLVGNAPDALALEVALSGPILQVEVPLAGVVFGAPFQLSASSGQLFEVGRTFNLAAGEQLKIGGTPSGCRAYLCVIGGFVGPVILGSSSALAPIRHDDLLLCGASSMKPRSGIAPPLRNSKVIRVLPGPQANWFVDRDFFNQIYTVAGASDRMGVRLLGTPLTRPTRELVSEAVAPGAVQITNDGLPVILGVDGQTIGGYPKIAHVIRADFDCVGQLRPGSTVQFEEVTSEQAELAHRDQSKLLKRTLAFWQASAVDPVDWKQAHSTE